MEQNRLRSIGVDPFIHYYIKEDERIKKMYLKWVPASWRYGLVLVHTFSAFWLRKSYFDYTNTHTKNTCDWQQIQKWNTVRHSRPFLSCEWVYLRQRPQSAHFRFECRTNWDLTQAAAKPKSTADWEDWFLAKSWLSQDWRRCWWGIDVMYVLKFAALEELFSKVRELGSFARFISLFSISTVEGPVNESCRPTSSFSLSQ